jgi:hypothetical protein
VQHFAAIRRTADVPPTSSICRACRVGPTPEPLTGRVEDWRASLGRSLYSLLSCPFVRQGHTISTVPRFQPRFIAVVVGTGVSSSAHAVAGLLIASEPPLVWLRLLHS